MTFRFEIIDNICKYQIVAIFIFRLEIEQKREKEDEKKIMKIRESLIITYRTSIKCLPNSELETAYDDVQFSPLETHLPLYVEQPARSPDSQHKKRQLC